MTTPEGIATVCAAIVAHLIALAILGSWYRGWRGTAMWILGFAMTQAPVLAGADIGNAASSALALVAMAIWARWSTHAWARASARNP